jgi:MFS transporter, DHA3 family, tetracycline resistance protein
VNARRALSRQVGDLADAGPARSGICNHLSQAVSVCQAHTMNAVTVFYLRNIADAFNSGLIFTSLYAYYVRDMHLTPFQLLLIGMVLMATGLLFEIPTGVVADVYSRRLSVIIGGALIGVGFLLVGTIPIYAVVLLVCFIEAVGDTFISGALEAWITDEIDAANVSHILIRSEQLGGPAHWTGIGASVLLATVFGHNVPIVVGGALWLALTVFLIAVMPERAFTPKRSEARVPLRARMKQSFGIFASGARLVQRTPVLLTLLIAQVFYGAFFEPFFRLNQAHMLTNLALPVVSLPLIGRLDDVLWFGLIDAAVTLLYFPASEAIRRSVATNRPAAIARSLALLFALALICALTFALIGAFALAVGALLILRVVLLLTEPLTAAWRNQHIPSDVRATVISMNSQAGMLGQLGGGLGVGAMGDRYGLRAALSLAGAFIVPLIVLHARHDPATGAGESPVITSK